MTLIKIEELNRMKYLKVENNKGYFLKVSDSPPDEWIEIDKVNKDDLMKLLNKAVGSEFEMDKYSEETLANKAHQIIYKRLYEKFNELLSTKDTFKDECESLYKTALEKYSKKD